MNQVEQQNNLTTLTLGMIALLKRFDALETRLEGPRPELTVKEAVNAYRAWLESDDGHKKPENYHYLLLRLVLHFGEERQFPTLTAEEVKTFIEKYWPGKSKGQRLTQLSGLWSHAILRQRAGKRAVFDNVCELIRIRRPAPERPEWIPPALLATVLRDCDPETYLLFAIPLSAGLRVSEIIHLRPIDVAGRILTLHHPKSGNDREDALLPAPVADRLAQHIVLHGIGESRRIFRLTRQGAGKRIERLSAKAGYGFGIHYLRKWCATYWENIADDPLMRRFVLRHADRSLRSRYVAPLKLTDAMKRQDEGIGTLFDQGGVFWKNSSAA